VSPDGLLLLLFALLFELIFKRKKTKLISDTRRKIYKINQEKTTNLSFQCQSVLVLSPFLMTSALSVWQRRCCEVAKMDVKMGNVKCIKVILTGFLILLCLVSFSECQKKKQDVKRIFFIFDVFKYFELISHTVFQLL
jgi:hypothetical protein